MWVRMTRRLPTGRYSTLYELSEALRRTLRHTSLADKVDIDHDKYINRAAVTLAFGRTDRNTIRGLSFSSDLLEMLGFMPRTVFNKPKTVAPRDADLERGLTALFVYANVVSPRLVGDAYVPLLRTVPVKGSRYANVHIEFKTIEYQPVANFNGREIEIKLARDTGQVMQFNTGKVIVSLHFRRIRK